MLQCYNALPLHVTALTQNLNLHHYLCSCNPVPLCIGPKPSFSALKAAEVFFFFKKRTEIEKKTWMFSGAQMVCKLVRTGISAGSEWQCHVTQVRLACPVRYTPKTVSESTWTKHACVPEESPSTSVMICSFPVFHWSHITYVMIKRCVGLSRVTADHQCKWLVERHTSKNK